MTKFPFMNKTVHVQKRTLTDKFNSVGRISSPNSLPNTGILIQVTHWTNKNHILFTYRCNGLSGRIGSRLIKVHSTLSKRLLIVRNTASLVNNNLTTKNTYKNGGAEYSNSLNGCSASKSGLIKRFVSQMDGITLNCKNAGSGKVKKDKLKCPTHDLLKELTLTRCLCSVMNPWPVLSIYIFPLNLTKVFSASALVGCLALRFKEKDVAY